MKMVLIYDACPMSVTALSSPAEALELEFMQTALAELLLLAVAGGLLGTWIVLRRLAFFAHAVGSAAFPGLVVAEASGFSPQLAGMAVALGFAGGAGRAERGSERFDAAIALFLTGALALGVVLASDLLDSGAAVDRLLFGTLLGLSGTDLAVAAVAAVGAVVATVTLGRSWLATGFDGDGARAIGVPVRLADGLLLALVAGVAVAALPAVGALLLTAVLIVPAATVRLLARSVPALLAGSVALAAAEGAIGLYIAYELDVSPGPALATLGAGVYALVALTTRRSPA
jgi:ABC-type Mn2+/Zn2+ transport system permease subunit